MRKILKLSDFALIHGGRFQSRNGLLVGSIISRNGLLVGSIKSRNGLLVGV